MQEFVIVERLDGGKSDEKGIYRCSECGWTLENAHRNSPRAHVERCHVGAKVKVTRPRKEGLSAEQKERKKERDRARSKRMRLRSKVSGLFVYVYMFIGIGR
jgi:hypothetical protein